MCVSVCNFMHKARRLRIAAICAIAIRYVRTLSAHASLHLCECVCVYVWSSLTFFKFAPPRCDQVFGVSAGSKKEKEENNTTATTTKNCKIIQSRRSRRSSSHQRAIAHILKHADLQIHKWIIRGWDNIYYCAYTFLADAVKHSLHCQTIFNALNELSGAVSRDKYAEERHSHTNI